MSVHRVLFSFVELNGYLSVLAYLPMDRLRGGISLWERLRSHFVLGLTKHLSSEGRHLEREGPIVMLDFSCPSGHFIAGRPDHPSGTLVLSATFSKLFLVN